VSFHNYAARSGFACLVAIVAVGEAHAQQKLTLQEAFARALGDAPSLQAAEQATLGAEAGVRQADRMPNPTLDITAENFAGGSQYQVFDKAETTFSLSQKLEWGGDRDARTRLAAADVKTARAGGGVRRQDVMHQVALAYLAVQKAGAELGIANERAEVARRIVETVSKRVQAARDPLLAGARSEALLADAEIGVEAARLADQGAKSRLASFWGGDANFDIELASFQSFSGSAGESVDGSAELALAAAEQERALAAVGVELARAQQDLTVSAGLRYFHETDEAALVVGVAIPLPFWDQNEGAIARAESERSRLRFETEAIRRNIEREANTARSQMSIARAEIESIDARLLPSAEKALAFATQGYNAGGFSYLDVLDAQRIVVQARLQRISAFHSYHSARVALARLTGAFDGDGAVQ
jgi:cobalt-zinc-cadmium efflux system outer membrane protein